ncbi:MAG: nitroreductase family protein [Bacteroidales bacterium]|nr:nitroreductase family protein [Bacteroidales bacterium]
MADNFLERRMEELHDGKKKTIVKRVGQTLDSLMMKNRSHRGYDPDAPVSEELLKRIVEVNTRIPSACNQQVLRFRLVTKDESAKVLPLIKMGAALPELHLPFAGTEPPAYIIICSKEKETKLVDMDLGISAQSMLLKAVEMGYNGLIIGAFNKEQLKEQLSLPYDPLLVVAIGKGIEQIRLKEIKEDESHKYYREEGVHIVPKVGLEDLVI